MTVTGPGQSLYLLLDVVDLLNESHIPYVVVGALAVSFHGLPRATNDADAVIWLQGTGKTQKALSEQLTQEGYRVVSRSGDLNDPVTGVIGVEDAFANRLDLLLGIRGMDVDATERCAAASVQGHALNIVGGEDLVALKVFAGGPQDLEDAKGILEVSKERLDLELVRSLANRYGSEVRQKVDALLVEN